MRILLVEDDETIVEVLSRLLTEQNYVVDVARDGQTGWELVESCLYDLVLLDIMLPRLDGISFCRRLREQKNQVLVMLLTTHNTTTDKLLGLDSGADDYVVKPFNLDELAARIRALLRRGSAPLSSVLQCGDLCVDPNKHEVTYQGQILPLSRKEYLLLELFIRNQHRIYSCREIVDHLWAFDAIPPDDTTVRSHIKNIRRHLKVVGAGDLLETLYGQGYRINPMFITAAATDSPVTVAKQTTLNVSVQEIWERTKPANLDRVVVLEQLLEALETGEVDPALYQQGIQNAHKLAGSLGMFGFEHGTTLARQMETTLQAAVKARAKSLPTSPQKLAIKIRPLLVALRRELAGVAIASTVVAGDRDNRSLDLSNTCVLAIDDDPQVLKFLKTVLEQLGVQLICLEDPGLFWETLQSCQPDLLILDINLPTVNGLELCQAIRQHEQWNWLPILFLTAYTEPETLQRAFMTGADDYLTKPIAAPELSARILNRLQRLQAIRTHLKTHMAAELKQI